MAEMKIGDREFKVGVVLATDALILQAKLMKVVGSGIERLPTILKGVAEGATADDKAAMQTAAVAAFTDIFVEGDPKELTNLIGEVVSMATVKRPSGAYEQVDLDGDFTERKGDLFEVVVFVLREVLGDFFSGLRDNGKVKKAVLKG